MMRNTRGAPENSRATRTPPQTAQMSLMPSQSAGVQRCGLPASRSRRRVFSAALSPPLAFVHLPPSRRAPRRGKCASSGCHTRSLNGRFSSIASTVGGCAAIADSRSDSRLRSRRDSRSPTTTRPTAPITSEVIRIDISDLDAINDLLDDDEAHEHADCARDGHHQVRHLEQPGHVLRIEKQQQAGRDEWHTCQDVRRYTLLRRQGVYLAL